MKRFLARFILILVSTLMCTSIFAADTYQFDNKHSYVLWHASHFNFSSPSGKWMVNGTLTIDPTQLDKSKVNAIIQIADLTTGIKEFNEHLMGNLFFDAKRYPTATFVSNKVVVTGKDTAKVSGTLTLRGIAKPVTLDVKLNKKGVSPITNKETLGFSAHTTIKRSDFGMNALLPGVGDDVKIAIEAEASR